MLEAMKIGRFQLENLARLKIGYQLINLGAVFAESEAHLAQNEVTLPNTTSVSSSVQGVIASVVDKLTPLIVICPNGELSAAVAQNLVQAGYLNVYFIAGGYLQLSRDTYGVLED